MIQYEDILKIIDTKVKPINRIIEKRLYDSIGYILAEEIKTDIDMPFFNRALRDGYAVVSNGINLNDEYEIEGIIPAGSPKKYNKSKNKVYMIMTGAVVPDWADAIIQFEDTTKLNNKVRFHSLPKKNQHIAYKSSDLKKGEKVICKYSKISNYSIPFIASAGYEKVKVFSRPEISFIITGDEIISAANIPLPGQVRDANTLILKSLINKYGLKVNNSCRLKDNKCKIKDKIIKYLSQSDIVIINGGVSKGLYDYVHTIIKEISDEILYYKALIMPGKPGIIGRYKKKYIIGMPGNPLAVISNFEMIAIPLIRKLSNENKNYTRQYIYAKLSNDYSKSTGRLHFVPGILYSENGNNYFKNLKFHNSGDVASIVNANTIMEAPKELSYLKKGDKVKVYLL